MRKKLRSEENHLNHAFLLKTMPKLSPKLSVCLVVWNAQTLIANCLESVKDVADEIIIVHDGPCSDRTLEICRRYTRKMYVRPFVGEAEPHRPFSFRKASGDWILWLDQDERLTGPLRKNIRRLIARKDADAYTFVWPVKYGTKNLSRGFFSRVRKRVLFRKSRIHDFHGLPNETLHVRGNTIDTPYTFIHLQSGERNTLRVFFSRTLRIVRIHARQLARKKLVRLPAPWYACKAVLWFLLYLGYYYIIKCAWRTQADRSISLQLALYNLYLYWYVFLEKMHS